jgi:uncharacterized protein (DUF2062 family)
MRKLLRRWLPPPHELRERPALRWLGPLLEKPWLWKSDRRGVSIGLACGLFFGFLLPIGQSLAAGALAVLLRANLPVAVAATFVSNPFTTPPIVAGAYLVGAYALGAPAGAPAEAGLGLIERASALGAPLAAGLVIFAIASSAAGFLAVQAAWRLAPILRLARRRRAASSR